MEYKLKCYEGPYPRINVTPDIIKRNRFTLARKPEEIMDRLEKEKEKMLGFQVEVLIDYLPWEIGEKVYSKEYRDKVASGAEPKPQPITDVNEAVQDMLDYLSFGYGKAMDERGISASRTVDKLSGWFWLLGRDDLAEMVNREDLYAPYGMPALIAVTKEMGLPVHEDMEAFGKRKVFGL